jgi:hypothetical protein
VDHRELVHLNQEKKQERQNVFEMDGRINEEVPHSEEALVAIGEDAIGVDDLISDQLVQAAALELHLLFEALVLDDVYAAFMHFIFDLSGIIFTKEPVSLTEGGHGLIAAT